MTAEPRYSPTLLALAAALTAPRWDDRADIFDFAYPPAGEEEFDFAPGVWEPRPTLLDSASQQVLAWTTPDAFDEPDGWYATLDQGYSATGTAIAGLTSALVAEYRTARPFFDGL